MFRHDLGNGYVMRLLEEQDAPALYAAVDANRAHLRRWLPWLDANICEADSLSFIRTMRQNYAANNGLQAALWNGPRLVGLIGFHHVDWANRRTSLGYWLAEPDQGQGLITRGCKTLIDHAFGAWKLNRVEIRAIVENKPSRAVIERLGCVNEGTVRDAEWLYDHFVDHVVYGLLARDWSPAG